MDFAMNGAPSAAGATARSPRTRNSSLRRREPVPRPGPEAFPFQGSGSRLYIATIGFASIPVMSPVTE